MTLPGKLSSSNLVIEFCCYAKGVKGSWEILRRTMKIENGRNDSFRAFLFV